MISVAKYFEKAYKRKLTHPDLPLVMMLPKEKNIYIPLELCYVMGGEHFKKKLSSDDTATMVRSCAKPAADRMKDINHYLSNNNYNKDETIAGYGIQVSNQLASVTGRVLPARCIEYGGNKKVQPAKGQWDNRNAKAYAPCQIMDWAFLVNEQDKFCSQRDVEDLGEKLIKGAKLNGINLKRPPSMIKYIKNVRELEQAFKIIQDKNLKFCFIILGRDGTPIYNRAKQLGDIEQGVYTQCMKSANLRKANEQFIGNLMMKINAKHGGINNIVKNPDGKQFLIKPTIIIGADVTHPAPGDNSKPSIQSTPPRSFHFRPK